MPHTSKLFLSVRKNFNAYRASTIEWNEVKFIQKTTQAESKLFGELGTIARCRTCERDLTEVEIDFGSGFKSFFASKSKIETNFLMLHTSKFEEEILRTTIDWRLPTGLDDVHERNSMEYIGRYNRFLIMLVGTSWNISACRSTRSNKASLKLRGLSSMLLNFSAMTASRTSPNSTRAGYGANVPKLDAITMNLMMLESLEHGREIMTTAMCGIVGGNRFKVSESTLGEGRTRADLQEFLDEEIEDYAPCVDASVFPFEFSYKLSTTSLPYKGTIWRSQRVEMDLDLSYSTWKNGEKTLNFGARSTCENAFADWKKLPNDRDAISRFIANEGVVLKSGLWSYYGTRAHRKCNARTLLCKIKVDNDGIDYAKATHYAPEVHDILVLENGYVDHKTQEIDWRQMNEEVTSSIMSTYSDKYAPDIAPIEHFTMNLRAMCKIVVGGNGQELCPEFPVYWPFGTHSRNDTDDHGKPFETRIDLVAFDGDGCIVIEYKTRMEVTSKAKDIYLMKTGTKDRVQLRLNTWMLYLNTGIQARCAYMLQASRRQPSDGFGNIPHGVVVKLETNRVPGQWASVGMVRLITRFAIHPYGPTSVARYADNQFVIPDLTALMAGLGLKTGGALTYDDETGRNEIFSKVLQSSCFSKAVDKAVGIQNSTQGIVIGLPDGCFCAPGKITAHLWPEFHGERNSALHQRIQKEWKFCAEHLLAQKYCEGNHAMISNGFFPLLFDRYGSALLFCNSSYPLSIQRVQFDDMMSATASQSAFVPLDALPLFRRPACSGASIGFEQRLRFGNDVQSTSDAKLCTRLRTLLLEATRKAAQHIEEKLTLTISSWDKRQHRLYHVPADIFWHMTIDDILRRPLSNSEDHGLEFTPRIREFARLSEEPYAEAPVELGALTQMEYTRANERMRRRAPSQLYQQHFKRLVKVSLMRCINRLLNVRLLRGALALVGVSDMRHSHVETLYKNFKENDEKNETQNYEEQWTTETIQSFVLAEQVALDKALQSTHSDGAEDANWWGASGSESTRRSDDYSRAQCFPHISQRAMWSSAALRAATGLMLSDDHSQQFSIVDIVRDHILEDLASACKTYLLDDNLLKVD